MFSIDWSILLIVLASGFLAYQGWLLGAHVQTYCCRQYSMIGAACGLIMASTVLLIALDPKGLYEYEHGVLAFWPVLSFWLAFVISSLVVITKKLSLVGRQTIIANSVILASGCLLGLSSKAMFTSDALFSDLEGTGGLKGGFPRAEVNEFLLGLIETYGYRNDDGVYQMSAELGLIAHEYVKRLHPGWA